jgi:HSP20 family molecular chaperone IbpA
MEYYYSRPVTWVHQTFPEHHLPFEDTRTNLTNKLHDIFVEDGPNIYSPRVDIRETQQRYYVDVELPGVTKVESVKLRWSNPSTIVLRSEVERVPTLEETEATVATPAPNTLNAKTSESVGSNQKHKDSITHLLRAERCIGTIRRYFEFSAPVKHDSLKSKLHDGLLSMVIEKEPHRDMQKTEVKIEHRQEANGTKN